MLTRFFSLLTLAALAWTAPAASFEGNLHVETYKGAEIAPYTNKIVQLSNDLFKKYPYLYDGSDAEYTKHLTSYAQSKHGVVSIAFDGNKVIGVATGIPLSEAWEKYQQPFRKKGENIDKIFYLGELLVSPEYTGKGLGQQMTKNVEQFAKGRGYTTITAQVIDEKSVKETAPQNHYSMTNVLKKLNYQERPEINLVSYWTNVNESKESPHQMLYWTKALY